MKNLEEIKREKDAIVKNIKTADLEEVGNLVDLMAQEVALLERLFK